MEGISFDQEDITKGNALYTEKKVKDVFFSEGTYQVEVIDEETYWPFLQVREDESLVDYFCTCDKIESTSSCAHLYAAKLQIYRGSKKPLHIRFQESFWNQLFQIAAKRHGFETSVIIEKDPNTFVTLSSSKKELFSMQAKSDSASKAIRELIQNRVIETEETSLKFSNLPKEEMDLWKRGTPSYQLQFELSFWSDLAKFIMLKQEEKFAYKIEFMQEKNELPTGIRIDFEDISLYFYLTKVNWPDVIPSLATVDSKLKVLQYHNFEIDSICYDEKKQEFHLKRKGRSDLQNSKNNLIKLQSWIYDPGIGFYPGKIDPLLKKDVIPTREIAIMFDRHLSLVESSLKDTQVQREPQDVFYELFFDKKGSLHIHAYIDEKGDLEKPGSAMFGSWGYIPNRGFFKLQNLLFESNITKIEKEKVPEFIETHKLWLNQIDGFQIHLANIESELTYHIDSKGNLSFQSISEVFESLGEFIDFGSVLYIKDKGFYPKKLAKLSSIISPRKVNFDEVAYFIKLHAEELESVEGFFSPGTPVSKSGLDVSVDPETGIIVSPKYLLKKQYTKKKVLFFGDYAYVKGEGFSKIPDKWVLPDKYQKKTEILEDQEAYFINYELPRLSNFVLDCDKTLQPPEELLLRVNKIEKDTDSPDFLFDLTLESEFGHCPISFFKEGMSKEKSYLLTDAGLIRFKDPRFQWLHHLDKGSFVGENKIRLSILDWIRLSALETIKEPPPEADEDTKQLFLQITTLQTNQVVNTSKYKGTFRPYQKTGVDWLYFLHSFSLSGLLCDEMGLGKTHQAMGLMAAVFKARKKIFILCPTSVIYHWEELIAKFIPSLRVLVFYGTKRSLSSFNKSYDVLLTSYGTLRNEKEALSKIKFELAIFDEIQIAKNASSQTHKSLQVLQSRMKLGLTGTPIENYLIELKSLFDIIIPGYFPSKAAYRESFVIPIEKFQDAEARRLLSNLTNPFLLRRKKTEVLHDLPEKVEKISLCDLSSQQRSLYTEAVEKQRESFLHALQTEGEKVPYLHIFSLLNTLKRICNHPCLVNKDFAHLSKYKSGKWELFKEILQEARESNQKVVVFTQYLDMMDIIIEHLKESDIAYATIRGSTKNRKEMLDKFKNDPKCEVFVASLKAVGVGVDLVSASVVIHYDRWWNPAKENQATDRVHRIGQNRGVQVFKLVTKHTIEEKIHSLIEKKAYLLENVIGYDDKDQVKTLSRDELLYIMQKLDEDL